MGLQRKNKGFKRYAGDVGLSQAGRSLQKDFDHSNGRRRYPEIKYFKMNVLLAAVLSYKRIE